MRSWKLDELLSIFWENCKQFSVHLCRWTTQSTIFYVHHDNNRSLRFFFYKAGWTIESEEKSSFQLLPLIVFEAHVLFHKTGERYALFEAHPFSLSYFLFALEWIRHFSFYIGGNVVLVKGLLGGWTFGGLKENADICAWIEMWFLHLELLITILLYGDIFKS